MLLHDERTGFGKMVRGADSLRIGGERRGGDERGGRRGGEFGR